MRVSADPDRRNRKKRRSEISVFSSEGLFVQLVEDSYDMFGNRPMFLFIAATNTDPASNLAVDKQRITAGNQRDVRVIDPGNGILSTDIVEDATGRVQAQSTIDDQIQIGISIGLCPDLCDFFELYQGSVRRGAFFPVFIITNLFRLSV